jgi:primase-polymerase (primpol)-like protein
LNQWVPWRSEERDGKATKVPYQARTRLCPARTNDPRTWASFERAVEMWLHHGERVAGIGFVFTADDPFCGIDLDNCYPSDAAECAPWAEGILERFSDTYAEQSPSGKASRSGAARKRRVADVGRWATARSRFMTGSVSSL